MRPVALSRRKVDVIVGNPPWLNYRNTASVLRDKLVQQSKELYHIWQGGRYATHQDVAGLFFARSVALYLRAGGIIAMVLPHSALQNRAICQVAHGTMGRFGGEFRLQNGVGSRKTQTQHVLSGCVLCRVCRADG